MTTLELEREEVLHALKIVEGQIALLQRGGCPLCYEAGDKSVWGDKHARSCALPIIRKQISKLEKAVS